MIKAEGLRIGNFVNTRHYNILKVTSLDSRKGYCNTYEDIYGTSTGGVIKPIPLTEDILLDCGFSITCDPENVHYKINVCNEYNEKFVINRKVGYNVFYIQHKDCNDYLHFTTQIKYVHQLQNLYFALTGKELEFKTLGK